MRDDKGWRDDEVWVRRLWHVQIMPSFNDGAFLGLVEFDESEFRGTKHPAGMRAAMVIYDQGTGENLAVGCCDVSHDPLRSVMRSVDLMPEEQSIFLDGIQYMLFISGHEISGLLQVSNPRHGKLKSIEQAVFEVAGDLQEATTDECIKRYLSAITSQHQ